MGTTIRRITRAWAHHEARIAEVLAEVEPSWGSETFELAGGRVVLCGAGLYVNRAMAVGHDGPLTDDDWQRLERRSEAVGVAAAIEITPVTHPGVAAAAAARGYACGPVVQVLARSTDLRDVPLPDPSFEIVVAADGLLASWQGVAARGWGHADGAARRASDAYARAAALVDGDGFVLARDARSGRPLGCASLAIHEDVATLGGMSTVPEERGRGVQASLVRHRLRIAAAAGCDLAAAGTVPGGASERNLIRHGFERRFTIEHWIRPAPR